MIHNISRFIAALALLATAQGAWADTETVSYIDADGNEQTVDATPLTSSTNSTSMSGWYVVSGTFTNNNRLEVWKATLNLILADDCHLTMTKSLSVRDNATLNIYSQSKGSSMGKLTITAPENYAGIGGYYESPHNLRSGAINIYGGDLNIAGGGSSAGIGGSFYANAQGAILITGGAKVVATGGQNGAGIGGGYNSSYSSITITGNATVTASGKNGGEAIGHGDFNTQSGTLIITSSTVNGINYDANGFQEGTTTYTVTFNSKGGTAVASQTVGLKYGQTTVKATEPTAPTRTNYTFGGWYKESSCTNAWDFASDGVTADVTLYAKWTPDPTHFSVNDAGTEYTIKTATGWNVFCDCLNDNETYNRFSGKTVRLGDNITVTRMAGGSNHAFTGTFDGGGHTLTLDYGTADAPIDAQFVAPFVEVTGGATFRNLTIAGTIYDGYTASGEHNLGGLIGHLFGTVTIEHCTSLVSIHAKVGAGGFVGLCEHSVSFNDCHSAAVIRSADGSNSGFVAWSRASAYTIAFIGCLFDGKLLQQNGSGSLNGGFIGWTGSTKTVTITNSLCAPAPLATGETMASSGSATFARGWNATNKPTNSYYTAAFEIAQGKATRTVTAGADVTIEAIALTGTATQYTVSGITAYSGGGLQHGQTLYYGSDDQLSLTLTTSAQCDQPGYQYAYTASAGTLSGSTLTMPDEDVTISVALAPIDWATVNQGNSADPYMIYNKDQLLLLAHRVNGTHGETANDYKDMNFKLGADITFDPDDLTLDEGQSNYEAIGGNIDGTDRYFRGTFDGDGHTVSGIRIRKDGNGNADNCQGLFGFIYSGADIHDVHLTDARIKGNEHVGGIAGYNILGNIRRCTVTDSYITATGYSNYGTICGYTAYTSSLTNNYYHDCTVNGTKNATNVGCCHHADIADITANNGALPAYAITLGANITTPPGTFAGQTEWLDTPPVDARLAPENGFTLADNHYFASGYEFTPGSTLASGAAQGYTPRATLGDVLLDLYTPTGDADPLAGKAIARLTITADCDGKTLKAAIRSDGQQHEVSYMTADGTTQTAQAVALDGHETVAKDGDIHLAAGTYYVGTDIAYANQIVHDGNITLILANGKTMTLNGNTTGIAIGYNLTIYGQSLDDATAGTLRYNGTWEGIHAYYYEQHSGNVSITTTGSGVFGINADVTLRGGTLTVTANGTDACAIYGYTHSILGGQLTATATGDGATGIYAGANDGTAITLGWTRPADRITASSISTGGGTVAVADGQALTDGSGHIYTGTLTAADLATLADKTTLQPCLALADAADNTAAITDHAGQRLAVALSGRTLYKDGSWNTLCLPFAVTISGSALDGDGVDVRTLSSAAFDSGTLTLNFTPAPSVEGAVTTIEAGVPYIIKWQKPDGYDDNPASYDLSADDLIFPGVTIDNTARDKACDLGDDRTVTFRGTYRQITYTDDPAAADPDAGIYAAPDRTVLFLGLANTLYYPDGTAPTTIGAQRAYFQLNGLTAGEPAGGNEHGNDVEDPVRAFVLNFGNAGDPARIIPAVTAGEGARAPHAWYTLDGRRLDKQPTAKGIYVNNGRKVVIK